MSTENNSLLLKQVQALIEGESDAIANAANVSSLLYHSLEDVNWVGFYFMKDQELVLGPFIGQPACTRIPIGKGVCGTAFAKQQSQLVADVHAFAGHIACDSASESEVVVPFITDSISGVLDVDSPIKARFTETDKKFFEEVTHVFCNNLSKQC